MYLNFKVNDGGFDKIEVNYRSVDKAVRAFRSNVEAYLVNLRVTFNVHF